jgi:hypothetical protein
MIWLQVVVNDLREANDIHLNSVKEVGERDIP